MSGFLVDLKQGLQDGLNDLFIEAGVKYRYTNKSDRTTDPLTDTTIDIFMMPTPNVQIREEIGGRVQEVLSAAAQLAAEALPVFQVSQKALRTAAGVELTPTTQDTFQELDANNNLIGQIFEVVQVVPIGAKASGFIISAVTQFHDNPMG